VAIRVGQRTHPLTVVIDRYVRGVVAAGVGRALLPVLRPAPRRRIVLFGHEPNGNLYAIDRELQSSAPELDWRTMVDDPRLYRVLRKSGNPSVLSAQKISHVLWAARAQAIVSSHGPVFFRSWLRSRRRPVFVDVWHGIGFKANIANAEAALLAYDAHLVSSPFVADEYVRAGAKPIVTGYARTDITIAAATDRDARAEVMATFDGIDPSTPLVLFAPTWVGTGDDASTAALGDSLNILRLLNEAALQHNFVVGYRGHINSAGSSIGSLARVRALSHSAVPITETLLGSVDVLVTDWSSIATDFLALDRPIVYLDRPAPAVKLAPLTAEDRVGVVASDAAQLVAAVVEATTEPEHYLSRFAIARAATVERAWGDSLDGRSAHRALGAIADQIAME
jgi:CDP-glycerol glycerophosphotransferase (TagB/SpsB family)